MDNLMNTKYWNLLSTISIAFIVFVLFQITQLVVVVAVIENDVIQGFQTALRMLVSGNSLVTEEEIKNVAYGNLGLISAISSIIGVLFIILFIRIKSTPVFTYLSFNLPQPKTTILFLCICVFFMFFSELISYWKPNVFDDTFVVESYRQANNLPILYIGVVIFGPLFEEVLFRGFLFKGLENSFVGGHGAVFISSLLFAGIHLQYDQTIILFILLPMAILLGYARLISKSLLLPILLHSINNLAACLVVHFEIY
jgi:membrane protease YdiL (CAAX protease family)